MMSLADEAKGNGAVGLATPNRTGAISESAVSQSSSTASRIIDLNTRRHFDNGCPGLLIAILRFVVFGAISTLNITKTRATERTKRLATCCADGFRPVARSSFNSRTNVSNKTSNALKNIQFLSNFSHF